MLILRSLGLLILLIFSNCKLTIAFDQYTDYQEKLSIQQLSDKTKSLFSFYFKFSQPSNILQVVSKNQLFSRSLIETLFLRPNATNIVLENAIGTINSVFLQDPKIGNKQDFPDHGTKLYHDEYAHYPSLLEGLSEMFKITKYNIKNNNHFKINNKFKSESNQEINQIQEKDDELSTLFQDNFFFAQDPTDYMCADNIEKLRRYFPCAGTKGLISMLDQSTLFRGDYIGLRTELKYHKLSESITFKISLKVVLNHEKITEFIPYQDINHCPLFNASNIFVNNKIEKDLMQDKFFNIKNFNFGVLYQQNAKGNLENAENNNNNMLRSNRFMGDKWIDFQGNLVHEVINQNSKYQLEVLMNEYLHWFFQPQLSKVRVLLNGVPSPIENYNFELQLNEFKHYVLIFKFVLKPLDKVRIIIPIDKIMKTFENYSHDPQRGHDLISSPVLFRIINHKKFKEQIFYLTSQNMVVRLPEPDFSMPFNIMTYTCVLMGYVYLIFFSVSVYKQY